MITIIKRTSLFLLLLLVLPFRITDYTNTEKKAINTVLENEQKLRVELEKQITCLAKNIYYESGFEPYEGKLAVATVTMNRVQHKDFPNTVCGVVYQRNSRGCQFSWTCGPRARYNQEAYLKAYEIAEEVLTEDLRLTKLKKALYFHNTTINPEWTFAEPIQQIGNHIFYVPRRNYTTS